VTESADAVLAFWRGAGPDKWFNKDIAFDDEIRARFLKTYEAAVRGELAAWELTREGALALVIVLDQFPRNMFRGSARAFTADPWPLPSPRGQSSAASTCNCRCRSGHFSICHSSTPSAWQTRSDAASCSAPLETPSF
jgi:hypothetical protein